MRVILSTSEEIQDVFEGEIGRLTDRVVNRYGALALCQGMHSMGQVQSALPDEFIEVCGAIERADMENE